MALQCELLVLAALMIRRWALWWAGFQDILPASTVTEVSCDG